MMKRTDAAELNRRLKILTALLVAMALSGTLPVLAAVIPGSGECGGMCCMSLAATARPGHGTHGERGPGFEAEGCCCRDQNHKPCDLTALPSEEAPPYLNQSHNRASIALIFSPGTGREYYSFSTVSQIRSGTDPPGRGSGLFLMNSSFLN